MVPKFIVGKCIICGHSFMNNNIYYNKKTCSKECFLKRLSVMNIGSICSLETREKLRIANIGRKHTEEELKKQSLVQTGRKIKPHSEEQKRRIGLAHKGMKHPPRSEEWKQRMSIIMSGRKCNPLSDETKRKISLTLKGKQHSEEHNKKVSLAVNYPSLTEGASDDDRKATVD